MYGGYSKEVTIDKNKNNSEKGIVHSDMWSLDPKTWEWNKVCMIFPFLINNDFSVNKEYECMFFASS